VNRHLVTCIGILAIGLAGALSACGSSDGTSQISKSQFLTLANQICVKGNQDIEVTAAKQFPVGQVSAGEKQRERFALKVIVPNLERQVVAIKKLGSPKGDGATVKIILAEIKAAIVQVERDPASFVSNGEEPLAKANKFAAAYGLTACAAR
jgi:hypothetical protein